MHISDGIFTGSSVSVLVASGAVSAGLAGVLLSRLDADRIPRIALCTSFFFVASLIHVPVGPTSVHLLLIGLVGIIMGRWAFLPILFGLILQALLFQHGGVTTIGVNALVMGLPAYVAVALFRLGRRTEFTGGAFLRGFAAGAVAVLCAALLLGLFLSLAGEAFRRPAFVVAALHLPLAGIEGVVTGFAAQLIQRVEPRLLEAGDA